MRICHVDTDAGANIVDGIANYVWAVAGQHAAAGHEVTILSRRPVTAARRDEARALGIEIAVAERSAEGLGVRVAIRAIKRCRPELVHFHGSWMPRFPPVAWWLRRHGIAYLYTPHGGLAPVVVASKASLRRIYTRVFEGPFLNGAAGLVLVNDAEIDDVLAVSPGFARPTCVASPPVHVDAESEPPWTGPPEQPTVIFLGRFSVFQKGLDELMEVAALLPQVSFRLFGSVANEEPGAVDRLQDAAPANVTFESPIFGPDKFELLRSATAYLQFSRFEGFPVSIVEALTLGVPTIVPDRIGLARTFRAHDIGAVVPSTILQAAAAIGALLEDVDRLEELGRNGRAYAASNLTTAAVAAKLGDFYESVPH